MNQAVIQDSVVHARPRQPRGFGHRPGVELDRVIVDKNGRVGEGSRLVNVQGLRHADGPNHHIREGILIVPKDAVIPPGTVV